MGLDARKQEWENGNTGGANIEATIHGIDEESDEIYIICAHYDSVYGSPGADDDGSGTAAVIAAAKLMSSYAFNNTVKFVAFSGEEQGLWGSHYYVEEAVENNDDIVAVLNGDMIGFALREEDESNVKIYENDESEWITDFTADLSDEYSEIFGLEVLPSGSSSGSDHYRFWQAGYDAVFYAEYNFNEYYHSSKDTIEHMNIPYAVRITKLMIATLADLSELNIFESPDTPAAPSGETDGQQNIEYTYSAVTTDPQNDQIYYLFDWGDGTDSGWVGPYNSGQTGEAAHSWDERGTYIIKVKAKDVYDHESEWSDPLPISMPKNKQIVRQLSDRFFEKFPNSFPILRLLL